MNNGFTLVEILVSVLILGLLFSGMYGVLSVGNIIFREDMSLVELQQQARQAMNYMSKELRQTNSNKISGVSEGDSNNTITFEIPYDVDYDGDVLNASGAIEWSNDEGDYRIGTITYSLLNNQILRNLSVTGQQSVLANEIANLTFSRPSGTDRVEIKLSAQKTVRNRVLSFPVTGMFTEQVKLRNP